MPTCPRCDSTDCRESPWQSEEEKRAHKGEQAWRCMACVHRFYAPRPPSRLLDNPLVAMLGVPTLVLMIAVTVIMSIWKS